MQSHFLVHKLETCFSNFILYFLSLFFFYFSANYLVLFQARLKHSSNDFWLDVDFQSICTLPSFAYVDKFHVDGFRDFAKSSTQNNLREIFHKSSVLL